jgi:predicted GNAT superfamily acetyltransferase
MVKKEKIIQRKGQKFLLRFEDSSRAVDYAKYEVLRMKIWGEPSDHLCGVRNMEGENYYHDGSSMFIGVFVTDDEGQFTLDEEHLIGFAYGYVGVWDKSIGFRRADNLKFYSQYAGVRPDFQGYGLGIEIKKFQREILLDIYGVTWATCTYDPLTAVNAYRNIHIFGMEVVEYRVDCYGGFGGYLNRCDIPTDRFYLRWNLLQTPQRPAYSLIELINLDYLATSVEFRKIKGRSGEVELPVISEVRPILDTPWLLVEIPSDFYLMLRETDVEARDVRQIPLNWRLKTRQLFLDVLKRGYQIVDFARLKNEKQGRTFYVLHRQGN